MMNSVLKTRDFVFKNEEFCIKTMDFAGEQRLRGN